MKKTYHFILSFFLFVSLKADYEHYLADYVIQEREGVKSVDFMLDNGWVFSSIVYPIDELKLFNLANLVANRVRIEGNNAEPGYRLIVENPQHRGYDKINFLVYPSKETADRLPTVSSLVYQYSLLGIFSEHYILLSDGSLWRVRVYNDCDKIDAFWEEGQRVIVSRDYENEAHFMLVNLDVVGKQRVIYWRDKYYTQCFYSIQDARNVRVVRDERGEE